MIHHHKHRRFFKKNKELAVIGMLFSFGLAAIDTVWAVYMESLGLNASQIGFLSGFFIIISLLTTLTASYFLEKIRADKILITALLGGSFFFFVVGFWQELWVFIAAGIMLTIFGVFRTSSFDILFRDYTKTRELSSAQGLLYTLYNISWLVGPLAAGYFIVQFGLFSVFYMTSTFFVIALALLVITHIKGIKKKRKELDVNPIKNVTSFFGQKRLRVPYFICQGLYFWWALPYIFLPLYIIEAGLGEGMVALFVAAVSIPLLFVELPVGKLSDKFGYRPFFIIGYGGLTLAAIGAFFVGNIYALLLLIILSSVFAGLLEPLQDSFFFSRIKRSEEEKYYPIFATAPEIGSLLGRFLPAAVLLFLPGPYIFIVVAAAMLASTVFAFSLPRAKSF